MIQETLFNIPFYTIPALNWSVKKKNLTKLFKSYADKKHGIQTFHTNRQSDRTGLVEAFTNLLGEELNMLSQKIKRDLAVLDVWSVTYKQGEYHSPHNHGTTGLTGILYLQLPKGSPVTNYIQPWNDYITDRTIYYPLPVQEGQIVVIPKFINHFSPPTENKKVKQIISWDMNIQ